ncbi:MAG: sigma-70 family RNA polymerase sigma factor [Elusimicrobia bacterium]|nr:sigma-70 family RNA polymerase sigma factor [Elusimicrobiota bacterium]
MTDAELMEAFANGETEALGEIIARYKTPLFNYLLRITGNTAAAEDLFQDVFVKLARSPKAYGERFKFSAWLFTVAHHAAMDYFRRRSAQKTVPLDGDAENPGAADCLASGEPGPEQAVQNLELKRRVEKALALLSEDQREIFYLRHYSGLSFREIAALLKIPIGTALARVSRAAAVLRRELENRE